MNRTEDQIRELARIVFDFYSDTGDKTARLVAGDALELIEERATVMLISRHDVESAMKALRVASEVLAGPVSDDAREELRRGLDVAEATLAEVFMAHLQIGGAV